MPNNDSSSMESDIAEIKKWTKIQGLETLSRILEDFTDEDLIIYHNADGESNQSEIADAADVGQSTVSRKLRAWGELGIMEKDGRQWKHIAPLTALGIDVPDLEDADN